MRNARYGTHIMLGILLIGIFLISNGVAFTPSGNDILQSEQTSCAYTTMEKAATDVHILFIMDHNYGANYHFIRPIFEGWGWTVTIAGTADSLTPCTYQSPTTTVDTDILISDITDITEYDCISIMPGNSHTYLLNDATTRNLIRTAVEEEMIVAAWCKAVRLLADADVIEGKNVTGNAEFSDEYEAAGATYMGVVPPVIDGNIVTGVRSRFYRQAMCEAIATAVGVFEEDTPVVSNISLNPETIAPESWTILSATISDATGIESARAEVYTLGAEGERDLSIPEIEFDMVMGEDNRYSANITNLPEGSYTIDIIAKDLFQNSIIIEGAINLTVAVSSGFLSIDSIVVIAAGTAVGGILIVGALFKMRKS